MARHPNQLKVIDCHDIIFDNFKKFTDHRPISIIPLESILMSSFAVFALKCPSLLGFEKAFQMSETRSENLKRLFRLERVPSDTQLREVLDYVNFEQFRGVFKALFSYVQRSKVLEKFVFMDIDNLPHYAVAVDGTGIFRSEKIKCPDCLVFERFDADNKSIITYGHNMLAASLVLPEVKQVIPFCPEAIVTQDGKTKNDSEITAFKRFMEDFKKDHPKLKIVFLLDALYANNPVIKLIEENGHKYIIAVKNTKSLLFSLVKEGEENQTTSIHEKTYNLGQKIIKKKVLKYRYNNNVRLHQEVDTPYVNFVDVHERLTWDDKDGNKKEENQYFSFITNIKIDLGNIEKIAQGGRTRWKVENETFNTLKNRGYNLEHNYGHGDFNLSYNFIMSMYLAFFVDQIQEISCLKFKKILEQIGSKRLLWTTLTGSLDWVEFDSWDEIYNKLLMMKAKKNSS
jgi:hypothetical protein